MNLLEEYKDRIVSVEDAVKAIKSGDKVVLGHAAGVPQVVPEEMVNQKDRLTDVSIFHMYTLHNARYINEEYISHFRHVTTFVASNTRKAVAENRADFIPMFFYEVPQFFDHVYHVDVAVVQVSLPDEEGYCSFGISCDYTKPAADRAKIVIAEMNDQMPRIGGNNKIHISKINYIVKTSRPLYESTVGDISELEQKIGCNCASLIRDGDTLQMGIGNIPEAVLRCLQGKRDLGIHTEMFSDGVVDLVKRGVITGKKKTLHPGKIISTFLMGSRVLYDFVDNNPDVEIYPVDYVNDPRIISQNDSMVSINSCIEVDLQGQVSSETMGLKQFSGTGGQVDFVRGSAMSKNGRAIIAIPSTASKGAVSRIVPFLTQGAAVTTSRNDIDYIVTEYGVAAMKGRSLRQRAKALIAIAHPKFRPQLEEEYVRRFGS